MGGRRPDGTCSVPTGQSGPSGPLGPGPDMPGRVGPVPGTFGDGWKSAPVGRTSPSLGRSEPAEPEESSSRSGQGRHGLV